MEKIAKHHQSLSHKITRRVFTGIITVIPLGVTIFIVYFIVMKIHSIFGVPITKMFGITYIPLSVILSLILAILSFYILGFFSTLFIVKKAIGIGEKLVSRIPVIRFFYITTKQIIDTISLPAKTAFQKPVLIEYPRKGIYGIGFVTGKLNLKMQSEEFINVFYPSTPNPTTGFFLMIPKEDVYDIDLTVEEAIKLIISAGILVPQSLIKNKEEKKIE